MGPYCKVATILTAEYYDEQSESSISEICEMK